MTLPIPNVPIVPGVPPLPGTTFTTLPSLLLADVALISSLINAFTPQWGIYDQNGNPVVVADSVVTMDFKQDWNLLTYPVEQGAFETYNKVQLPFEVRLRFAAGGSTNNRQALLSSIQSIAGDFNLYNVYTPEERYQNVNITHFDYHRSAEQGVGLMIIDIWAVEVRSTASVAFSNTQTPNAANPTAQGTVQPQTLTPSQLGMILPGGAR